MSNNLLKALVIVLFASGIFAFVYYKSNSGSEAENEAPAPFEEMTTEEPNEHPGGDEDYNAEEAATPTDSDHEKTAPPKVPVEDKKTEAPAIDDIIIPSSKSLVPINLDDVKWTYSTDSTKKKK